MAVWNYIKDKESGVYHSTPYTYSGTEGNGIIKNIELSTGVQCPMLVTSNSISISDDKIIGYVPKDMSYKFLASETGDDVAPPEYVPNCALDASGIVTWGGNSLLPNGHTLTKLMPTNPGMTLQFATALNGAVFSSPNGAPTSITYYSQAKEPDGSYLIETAPTGRDGNIEVVFIRQVGCTSGSLSDYYGGKFAAYINATSVTPPSAGKFNVPVVAICWSGWYKDYVNDNDTTEDGIAFDYDERINITAKNRKILSDNVGKYLVPFYGQQGLSPTTINTYSGDPSALDHTYTNVTVKFDKSQSEYNTEIGYANYAGISAFCFNWYDVDSPLSRDRQLFANSTAKGNLKMTGMIAALGFFPNTFIDDLTDQMIQNYWFKIDNKAVLYVQNANIGWSDGGWKTGTTFQWLSTIRSSYSSKGGGDIYFVNYEGNDIPYTNYDTYGLNAGGHYCTFGNESLTTHSYTALANEETNKWNAALSTGRGVVPTITTGFDNNEARFEYPSSAGWTNPATTGEFSSHLSDAKNFADLHPDKVKFVTIYAWDEITESGNPLCPRLTSGGGINKDTLDVLKSWIL